MSKFLLPDADPEMPGVCHDRGMTMLPGGLYVTAAERAELTAGLADVWVLLGSRFQIRDGHLCCTRGCGPVCQPRDGDTLDVLLTAARRHQCPEQP